jgi:hypothetical protein
VYASTTTGDDLFYSDATDGVQLVYSSDSTATSTSSTEGYAQDEPAELEPLRQRHKRKWSPRPIEAPGLARRPVMPTIQDPAPRKRIELDDGG